MGLDRYAFIVEYNDTQAALVRQYQLLIYLTDKTIEMHDYKNRRVFLKRCNYPGVELHHLYIGAVITVYSRQISVVDYADDFTRRSLSTVSEKTFALIKPDAVGKMGKIIMNMEAGGTFRIGNMRMFRLNKAEAEQFCQGQEQYHESLNDHVNLLASDNLIAIELVGQDAVSSWKKMCGPNNTFSARQEAPKSLRAQFGLDSIKNAVHAAQTLAEANLQHDFFFGQARNFPSTAVCNNCALCIIKPHAIRDGLTGKIIDAILAEGFEVSALQMFNLSRSCAEEFCEVYKGVIPEYGRMVEELAAGSCVAMEIRAENAVETFRALAGPLDPEVCQLLRPNTLRAAFGSDKVRNAVHCTDLPEDGVLEVEYFFKILQNQ
jgi:nucleoside-diphosphate kinase